VNFVAGVADAATFIADIVAIVTAFDAVATAVAVKTLGCTGTEE
jgi:hypothetical protein